MTGGKVARPSPAPRAAGARPSRRLPDFGDFHVQRECRHRFEFAQSAPPCFRGGRLKRLLHALLVFLTCLQLCGGPQGFMQCVAWAGMLASYASERTAAEAVEMTFDGEHPCALCLAIEQSRGQEPEGPANNSPRDKIFKLLNDLPPLTAGLDLVRPLEREPAALPGGPALLSGIDAASPAVPPPRV